MNRLFCSALGLTAALVCSLPALAQEDLVIHVSYADLNLANPAGSATFARRIDNAVAQVCGPRGGVDLSRAAVVKSCWTQVGAAARAQMETVVAQVRPGRTSVSVRAVTLASR